MVVSSCSSVVRGVRLTVLAGLVALVAVGCDRQTQASPPAVQPPEVAADGVAPIRRIAAGSKCAARVWGSHRGRAPQSYIEGTALVFARSVCQPQRADVQVVSAPADLSPTSDDALALYRQMFANARMQNDVSGLVTLRHSYALLIGLGMMESSGKYCEGRDVSQCFAAADSAEAGLFQTSYGARRYSPVLPDLVWRYTEDQSGCMLGVFQGGLSCPVRRSQNPRCPAATSDVTGTGPGADWQRLTRSCPAFATEYAAVLLRTHGGANGEFGPIRHGDAEVAPECDAMLQDVQTYVGQHPEVCPGL